MTTNRQPWRAALLSLLAPGLGQLYAGSVRLAMIWGGVALAVQYLIPLLLASLAVGLLLLLALHVGAAFSAARLAGAAPRPYSLEPYNRWYVYLAAWVAAGVAVQPASHLEPYATFNTAVRVFSSAAATSRGLVVSSASMEPTLLIGDHFFSSTSPTLPPTDGSLVTFASVDEPGFTILKRIVGTPGDTIAMVGGQLSRNGRPVREPYLGIPGTPPADPQDIRTRMVTWQAEHLLHPDSTYAPDLSNWGPFLIPPESVFVLGDNRAASWDSRYWGFVPIDHITGAPRLIYFSYDPKSWIPLPVLTAIRWNRIGLRFP